MEINRKTPDLLILDLNLPDIDGFKICSTIKSRSATKEVPIFMLTARDTIGNIEEGYDLGATEYFVKPVDDEKLLEAIRKHI